MNLIRLPPGSLPLEDWQGHSPRPPEHLTSSWLLENMGEGREGRLSCVPPTIPSSIITLRDGHSCAPGKEQQEAAGSKRRVAQPGHHGENTKNKPKKIPQAQSHSAQFSRAKEGAGQRVFPFSLASFCLPSLYEKDCLLPGL